ncbi:MAG: peptidoglycan DD-metalloendopeptidase family protein [Candidatus Hydrogenedentes bacterium]|nr:peptidoglycan DD-metalloendopeptidase family protein [Candidatus Hydrogenedentota bacterium]
MDPIKFEQARVAPALALPRSVGNGKTFQDLLQKADPLRAVTAHVPPNAPVHTVKPGETLSDICRTFLHDSKKDSSDSATWEAVQKVASANGIKNANYIVPGQVINLNALRDPKSSSSVAPPAMVVSRKAALPPPVAPSVSLAVAEAKTTPSRPSSLVFRDASLSSSYLNREAKTAPRADLADLLQNILSPAPAATIAMASEPAPAPKVSAALETVPLTGPWAKLVNAPAHITSEFGIRKDPFTGRPSMHTGIDLAADKGSKIYPVEPGTVTFSGWMDGYGKVVFVRHQNGLDSVYGHNASNLAKVGDKVTTTTPIGLVGATGRATGAHVHFEIRKHGHAVDPVPLMKSELLQVAKTF